MVLGRKIELPEDEVFEDAHPLPQEKKSTFGRGIEFSSGTKKEKRTPPQPERVRIGRPIDLKGKEISKLRSMANAFLGGAAEGLVDLLTLPSLIPTRDKKFKEDIREQEHFLREKQEGLQRNLPHLGEMSEKILHKVGKYGSGGVRGAVAGGIEGAAEALGAPEWLQKTLGIGTMLSPGFKKNIIPTKAERPLVNLAREAGLEEAQIAPLLPGKGKKAFLSTISVKGPKTERAVEGLKQGKESIYRHVEGGPLASTTLSSPQITKLGEGIEKTLQKMPVANRRAIREDYEDLLAGEFSLAELANFYHDLNSHYNVNKASIQLLKKPILEAMEATSPQFARDFKLANEYHKKYLSVKKSLAPSQYEGLLKLGTLGKFAHDLLSLSTRGLTEITGATAARRVAREMLINPRMQNLGLQMVKAIKDNKTKVALHLARQLKENADEQEE